MHIAVDDKSNSLLSAFNNVDLKENYRCKFEPKIIFLNKYDGKIKGFDGCRERNLVTDMNGALLQTIRILRKFISC